ncbi:ABC transporter ATP-binding protein [Alkaliphilus peptidifermentans]|uniref:Simple sugar transport system ATP-binding protein n=1 Tax=Alkaliphilus peptidifermentans DSM 18978 TaxID=1120976 RepID=A0A1G5KSP3_9FIRM|nr:ABC transporter ATP-binding protein [Alkaliphilus peptidifermentans]SCZ03626.1 simple sugar transport system ATP-binding protein [Alkaliphilus peptidifermentans DSM 18978]
MNIDFSSKVVEMKNITKKFGDFVANDNINLTVHKGEVHALLGENGAGKSTLMNILYGLYQPTAGEIFINGNKVDITDPNVAIKKGIGMVHQHFMLVEPFTVAENIILGMEPTQGIGALDMKKAVQDVEEISKMYGLHVNPNDKIYDITVGMQQRVEILKALYRGAEILILDEPTAVLTPQEIKELIQIMRNLTQQGKTIILITHKLKEIKEAADFCTIIRRGKHIDTVEVQNTSTADLASMMVGREVSFKVEKEEKEHGELVLSIEDLVVKDNRNIDAVKGLSLDVYAGEILGIAGVDGNGQSEFIEALTGLRRVESGKIKIHGKDITNNTPKEIIEERIASIPEDRQKRGLVLDYTIAENMILENYNKPPFAKKGILNQQAIKDFARKLIEKFDVRPDNQLIKARSLSGGNQQKVIIAREVTNDPEILIAAQPTRGLDVGAIEFVHKSLVEQRDKNKAVVLVSLELDEVMNVSDRIAVIYEGKIVGIVNAKEADENTLGLMMAGGGTENEG